MTTHLLQHPGLPSESCFGRLPLYPPLPIAGPPDRYDDISLLYLRISRTMSENALSTLRRDFAEVSINAQPNWRARSSPSGEDSMISLRNTDEFVDQKNLP